MVSTRASETLLAVRLRVVIPVALATMLSAPATASAAFPHVVASGESLSSVAAGDGLTVDQLAGDGVGQRYV